MWVTKLLIFPVEIRIFCPKTTKFGPKLAFLINLGQAMQAYSMPFCGSVGDCGARAVSHKTPIYFMIHHYFKPEHEKYFSFLALDFRCSCQFSSVDVLSICMLNGTSSSTSYEYKHCNLNRRGEIVKVDSSC